MQDVEVLPHLYSENDVARLFPSIESLELGPKVEDWEPSEEEQWRANGRLGNATQVLGRREERTSAAPSRRSSCVEAGGDPARIRPSGPRRALPPGSER